MGFEFPENSPRFYLEGCKRGDCPVKAYHSGGLGFAFLRLKIFGKPQDRPKANVKVRSSLGLRLPCIPGLQCFMRKGFCYRVDHLQALIRWQFIEPFKKSLVHVEESPRVCLATTRPLQGLWQDFSKA